MNLRRRFIPLYSLLIAASMLYVLTIGIDIIRAPGLLDEDSAQSRATVLAGDPVQFTLNVTASTGLSGVSLGDADWGDYDNDGDFDILLTGRTSSGRTTAVFRNSDGAFVKLSNGFDNLSSSDAAWGDYDNDGDLDFAVCGVSTSGQCHTSIYQSSNGTFRNINERLPGTKNCSLAWGDYDNDGDSDLLVAGYSPEVGSRISRVYKNSRGSFTDIGAGLSGVESGDASWVDYDNDGDLDVLIVGDTGSGKVTELYNNEEGSFTKTSSGLPIRSDSRTAWGDYDNDGDLDLLLAGYATSDGEYHTQIFENTPSGFADISAGLPGTGQGGAAWGDYDNDGDLDLALCGQTVTNSYLARVYRNDGGSFVDIGAGLPDMAYCDIDWGDYDGDTDLDLMLIGREKSITDTTRIYENLQTDFGSGNNPPFVPEGLSSYVTGATVDLSWNHTSDWQTTSSSGLNYNIYIGTSSGLSDTLSPMAFIDSRHNGVRTIPAIGNAGQVLSHTVSNLYPGVHYWSVQAIDTAYAGSPWATEDSFTVEKPDLVITKTVNVTDSLPGDELKYVIDFRNLGNIAAEPAQITDVLPSLIVVENIISNPVGSGVTVIQTGVAPTLTWSVSSLQPNQGGTITITAKVDDKFDYMTAIVNTAIISAADDQYNYNDYSTASFYAIPLPNTPPTVTAASNQTATVGVTETFALGSFTDTYDIGPWLITVDWGNDPEWDFEEAETQFEMTTAGTISDQPHVYSTLGMYTVIVYVQDIDSTNSAEFQVQVNPPNTPPTVTAASDQSASFGSTETFNLGSFIDPDNDAPWNVSVNWGDGTADHKFQVNTAGVLPDKTHAYHETGAHTVTVAVNDGMAEHSDTFRVDVSVKPTDTGGVKGTVYEDLNGNDRYDNDEGVAGASVTMTMTVAAASVSPVQTDAEGRYEFSNVPVGDYVLTMSKSGYLAPDPVNITVTKDLVASVQPVAIETEDVGPSKVYMPVMLSASTD